jgi:hypothetical protein
MLLLTALQLFGVRGHRRHEVQLPPWAIVTPLPPKPNTAVTLLVSSASASASRLWCSGRTTENRDNVFMNNRWSYNLGVPSVYAAGRRLNAAQSQPSGSSVAARAPHCAFQVYVQGTLVVDLPGIRSDRFAGPSNPHPQVQHQ